LCGSNPVLRDPSVDAIHHRERSAFHVAELQRVTEHFEAFKATALVAAELAGEAAAPPALGSSKPRDHHDLHPGLEAGRA
jgi:hypothetical protein